MPLLTLSLLLIATQVSDSTLQMRVAARIAKAPARAVGVYYRDLAGRDSLTVGSAVRFHAASTMKVPVMIQLFATAMRDSCRSTTRSPSPTPFARSSTARHTNSI